MQISNIFRKLLRWVWQALKVWTLDKVVKKVKCKKFRTQDPNLHAIMSFNYEQRPIMPIHEDFHAEYENSLNILMNNF